MVYTPIYTSVLNIQTKAGLSVTEVDLTASDYQLIEEAENEVELITGRKFTKDVAMTEYLSGPKKDVLGVSGQKARTINISCYPVQTITSFLILNTDGTTADTLDTWAGPSTDGYESDDYWMDSMEDPLTRTLQAYGKVTLKNEEFPVGNRNIKVVYTYGYASVPKDVKTLATCIGAIKMWVAFMGGQYNRLDNYSVPQQSVGKGNFYDRGNAMIEQFKAEAEKLLDRIGRRSRILFFATGGDR